MRFLSFLLLGFSLIVLTGCPDAVDYALDEPGKHPIDPRLLGTWHCDPGKPQYKKCLDLVKIKVTKGGPSNSYAIEVLETGSSYNADETTFTGYLTGIDGKNFIYSQAEGTNEFYIYCYEISGNELTLWDVELVANGPDDVIGTESLRAEVSASLKRKGGLTNESRFARE